ncbi:MAG: FlgO family outer membrane protein [Pseudomonadota bacterium]
MGDARDNPEAYSFGNFKLDLRRNSLRSEEREIKLRRQSFEVLKVLLSNHRSLVTIDRLHDEVWKDAVVTRDSLTQCLVEIRKAIGDTDKRIIRTIPRQGYIFEQSVASIPAAANATAPFVEQPRRTWVLAVGVAFAALASWLLLQPGGETIEPFNPPKSSIAVLPFLDLSNEQNLKYFGASLSEEVIHRLAQSPGLHVLGRTSSFSFQDSDADIRTISERLNARYLLEGSVRESGGEVRVVAQLIDASNDKHVWSEAFDIGLEAATDIQSEIALAVAGSLQADLVRVLSGTSVTDPVTFNLFGHARQIINSRELDQLPVAIELLKEALERDPTFIRAMTELSRAYYQQRLTDQATLDEAVENAYTVTNRVLELVPDDPIANAWKGWRELFHHKNYESAAAHYRVAFAADPTNVDIIRSAIPVWLTVGRVDEAVQLGEYLVAHDPLCIICQRFMVLAYVIAERFEAAEAHVETMLRLYPGRGDMKHELTKIKLLQGEVEEALRLIEDHRPNAEAWLSTAAVAYHRLGLTDEYEHSLELLNRRREEQPLSLVFVYAATGNIDAAFRWLRVYYETTKVHALIGRDPVLKPLLADPRWHELRSEFSLTDEQFAALEFPTNLPR